VSFCGAQHPGGKKKRRDGEKRHRARFGGDIGESAMCVLEEKGLVRDGTIHGTANSKAERVSDRGVG